jgi:hypothetical protein
MLKWNLHLTRQIVVEICLVALAKKKKKGRKGFQISIYALQLNG